jgi:hypothetical protein
MAPRHRFTACSSQLCTLLPDSPFLLKIEPSSRPSRPNFNSRTGFCENSMSSEVVQADQIGALRKSSLGIVGTLRRQNCPLIGFGNFAVRAERPSRFEDLPADPGRFPASPVSLDLARFRSRLAAPCMRCKSAPVSAIDIRSSQMVSRKAMFGHNRDCALRASQVRHRTACRNSMIKGCGEADNSAHAQDLLGRAASGPANLPLHVKRSRL